jgi:predicted GTPase
LIKKSNESKNKIEDKDIILVMGKTGSGKSTTILRFFGQNFKRMMIKGQTVYVPDDNLEDKYASFHTSFEAVSCTSFINAEEIPHRMYKKKKEEQKPLYICDSAGFGDSRGC